MKWAELSSEERNRLVAEKVMNWQVKECDGEIGEQPISPDGWYCLRCGYDGSWGDDTTHEQVPSRYTQSLDDAWQVLSKFYEEHSADGELHAPLAYHLGVTYYEPAYHSDVFQISSLEQLVNLTPERICKAILQTCGVKIE